MVCKHALLIGKSSVVADQGVAMKSPREETQLNMEGITGVGKVAPIQVDVGFVSRRL